MCDTFIIKNTVSVEMTTIPFIKFSSFISYYISYLKNIITIYFRISDIKFKYKLTIVSFLLYFLSNILDPSFYS